MIKKANLFDELQTMTFQYFEMLTLCTAKSSDVIPFFQLPW